MPNKRKPENKKRKSYLCIRFNDDELKLIDKFVKNTHSHVHRSSLMRSIIIDKVKDLN